MIKVDMLSILNASKVFSELAETNFSGAVAFKIARLIREMNKEIEDFDKQRANIAREYGAKDDNGELIIENNNIRIDPERIEDCNKELEELFNTEVELNANKLRYTDIEGAEITPQQAISIMDFIEMDD